MAESTTTTNNAVELSPVLLQLERQVIDLNETLEESPIFREKIKLEEESVDELVQKLKKLVKTLRQVRTAGEAFGTQYSQLANAMQNFSERRSEPSSENANNNASPTLPQNTNNFVSSESDRSQRDNTLGIDSFVLVCVISKDT
jgi:predicted transcriptional regulator